MLDRQGALQHADLWTVQVKRQNGCCSFQFRLVVTDDVFNKNHVDLCLVILESYLL